MAQTVRNDGAELVLLMYPDIGANDREATEQVLELKKLSADQGYGFIDLTPGFKAAYPKQLFLQIHLSREGHEVVATELVRYFSALDNL
jgi:hypothetical protein